MITTHWLRRIGEAIVRWLSAASQRPPTAAAAAVAALWAFLAFLPFGYSREIHLKADPDQVLNPVDVNIYGQFLEHIYHSANGGLWGELIWDRSFEGLGVPSWRIEKDVLIQEGTRTDTRLTFGEPTWTDFEFSLEARITSEQGGIFVYIRDGGRKEQVRANEGKERGARDLFRLCLSADGGSEIVLERSRASDHRLKFEKVCASQSAGIQPGEWHAIRLRCQGPRIQAWLDGTQVIEYVDDGTGSKSGRLGVGTADSQAEFRNFKVTALDAKVLMKGLPPLDHSIKLMPSWRAFGDGKVGVSEESPFNGQRCQIIESHGPEAGALQTPMAIRANETYTGTLWLRGHAASGVSIRLLDGATVLAEAKLSGVGEEWKEAAFALTPKSSADNASFAIVTSGTSKIAIDEVSLMPESWRNEGGFRPDLLKAVADLQPSIIRWPGGLFAERYRWKSAIGPQCRRQHYPVQLWDDLDVNCFGTDEFVSLCRKVKAEPVMVINTGRYDAKTPRSAYVQEACDWIEYCNGPATSKWGSVRAKNGHPEPYGVKYWEIDNEVWLVGLTQYVEIVNEFAPAMKKTDPSIDLLLCGGGGLDNHWTDKKKDAQNWNPRLIDACADKASYLSIHKYADPKSYAEGPLTFEAHIQELGELLAKSSNPKMGVFVSEWNAQSTDWRSGLYAGGLLNAFERQGQAVRMACPALFLRHVSATDWNNAFINFDHRAWYPGANYVVMKLWRENYAPVRIALAGETSPLNVVATKAQDGSYLVLKTVNPSAEEISVRLELPATYRISEAFLTRVAPGTLGAQNSLDHPDAIHPERGESKIEGTTVHFNLPAQSVGALKLSLK